MDVKRGDISTTAQAYAQAAKRVGAHGVTLNSYMGYDAVKPFLEEDWGGCFILCKNSNPSAEWGTGVVVGATDGTVLLCSSDLSPRPCVTCVRSAPISGFWLLVWARRAAIWTM